MQNRQIEIFGEKLNYLIEESGKPKIIFVHGFNSNSSFMKSLVRLKNRKFDCISLDLPGSGLSSYNGNEPITIEYYKKFLIRFIEEINFKNIILLGHSLGGAIVAGCANHDMVSKIVFIAPFNPYINKFINVNLDEYLKPTTLEWAIKSTKSLIFNRERVFYFNNIEKTAQSFINFVANNGSKYDQILYQEILSDEYQNSIIMTYDSITKASLFIQGEHDVFVPALSIKKLLNGTNHEYKEIMDCGHSPIFEYPEQVCEILNNFL